RPNSFADSASAMPSATYPSDDRSPKTRNGSTATYLPSFNVGNPATSFTLLTSLLVNRRSRNRYIFHNRRSRDSPTFDRIAAVTITKKALPASSHLHHGDEPTLCKSADVTDETVPLCFVDCCFSNEATCFSSGLPTTTILADSVSRFSRCNSA